MRRALLPFVSALALAAETRTLTLTQALDMALKQNPDVVLARLDEQKAAQGVRIARDPFYPKVVVGSGLAYSHGFPMSIEGSAPSIVQARAIQSLFNRAKSFEVAAARENARGAAIDTAAKKEDAAYRVANLFLDTVRIERALDQAGKQAASLEKVAATVSARVAEGRELPIENRRSAFNVAQARQTVTGLETDLEYAQTALALALGYGSGDRVRAIDAVVSPDAAPDSEEKAVEAALSNSKDMKRLESALQAKGLEARSARASALPQLDLVAQYGLFAKFNNYEDFFRRFQRNNGQVGVSIQWPVFAGSAAAAQESRAQLDMMRLRTEMNAARDRIDADTRRAYRQLRHAESGREVARMDLELTREQLTLVLAQQEEGRATLRQVEELRSAEAGKWIAFYDAEHLALRARLNVLKLTGTLEAALR